MDARNDLLAEESCLHRPVLDVLRPERGLTLDQADHMIENVAGVLGSPDRHRLQLHDQRPRRAGTDGHRGAVRGRGGEQRRPDCPRSGRLSHLQQQMIGFLDLATQRSERPAGRVRQACYANP
jgi:hypothetical protein